MIVRNITTSSQKAREEVVNVYIRHLYLQLSEPVLHAYTGERVILAGFKKYLNLGQFLSV